MSGAAERGWYASAVALSRAPLLGWLLLAACSEPGASGSAELGRAADAAVVPPEPVELEAGFFTVEGEALTLLADGDQLPVRIAAQGGYAAYAGARIRGLEAESARVVAELVDPTSGEVLVSDSRTLKLVADADRPDQVEPPGEDSANFLHLLACPNYGDRMVHGLPWTLSVRMDDPRWVGSTSVTVVPFCAPGSRFLTCVCECEPGYVFAKCGSVH